MHASRVILRPTLFRCAKPLNNGISRKCTLIKNHTTLKFQFYGVVMQKSVLQNIKITLLCCQRASGYLVQQQVKTVYRG